MRRGDIRSPGPMPVDWLVQAAARVGTMTRLVEAARGGNRRVATGTKRAWTLAKRVMTSALRIQPYPSFSSEMFALRSPGARRLFAG
jgi:hypothetical protein